MAEIAVNLVVDKLIPLLRYEVKLLKEVHSEVASIERQLCLIRAYLKDADAKAEEEEKTNVVKEWVKQVREVAHRIEDVVDEYLLQVAQRRQKRGLAGVIEKIARLLRSIEPRHGISSEIRDINNVIDTLDKRKDTLGFVASGGELSCDGGSKANSSSGGGTGRHDPRRGALLLEDEKFVRSNDTWKRLNRLLVGEDTRRTVIAVVGSGGLGKTIITWKLYEKQRDGFDRSAWVTVSSTFEGKSIFKSMLKDLSIRDDDDLQDILYNRMSMESIMKEVRKTLQDKNYLIVFDDVRAQDFWGIVETVLPEKNNGSRVIITTRDKGVAEFCKCSAPVYIHELQGLDPGDAMDLFLHKAFQFEPKGCPQKLQTLSEAIVKKCDGVPLAIVAIASLLSTKNNNFSEWLKVHDNFGSKLATDPHLKSFNRVLSESYNDLPFHLKPCLYFDSPEYFNGDFALLANFTNPNKRIDIRFESLDVDLFFSNQLISAQSIEPFSQRRRESRLRPVRFLSSLVFLPEEIDVRLQRQVQSNRVRYDVRGTFRVRLSVGLVHVSYLLHSICQIEMTGPPTGVLVAKNCITKR